jgi:hypothetical protein
MPDVATKIINLTDKRITILDGRREVIASFPPCPQPAMARISTQKMISLSLAMGVPIKKTVYLNLEPLPEPERGTYLIVSFPVKRANPSRSDLLSPADPVLSKKLKTIGFASLEIWES